LEASVRGISIDLVIKHYPYLYHMAEPGSWESIEAKGLLSTSALLDLFEIDGKQRFATESCHRPEQVVIEHEKHGRAIIRDQKPMRESTLLKCLEGVTPRGWYEFLNKRVFLWATSHRLESLLRARAYRNKEHIVLKVDTAKLLSKYGDEVLLSPINSGSTIYRPVRRNVKIFQPLKGYPFEERKRKRGISNAVAEFAFDYAIPDIRKYVVRVERRREGRVLKVILRTD
jgi:uncharacterized protein DUF7002